MEHARLIVNMLGRRLETGPRRMQDRHNSITLSLIVTHLPRFSSLDLFVRHGAEFFVAIKSKPTGAVHAPFPSSQETILTKHRIGFASEEQRHPSQWTRALMYLLYVPERFAPFPALGILVCAWQHRAGDLACHQKQVHILTKWAGSYKARSRLMRRQRAICSNPITTRV